MFPLLAGASFNDCGVGRLVMPRQREKHDGHDYKEQGHGSSPFPY
jgi:hypothetical protein